jgi:carbon storage regulator CsrA
MLVLSRKKDESIVIINLDTQEKIVIMVTECHTGNVSIGIQAPFNYKILRKEIEEKYASKRTNS